MKKILLIEDNLNIRETTAELLELADYEVVTAENGKIGIELAKTINPDIILCDIMMPELDGYGVINILSKKPETSIIPFIFLSAKSDKIDLRKGMNLGADDYITKPFHETELIEAIETRLTRHDKMKKTFSGGIDELNDFMTEAKGFKDLKDLSVDRKVKSFRKKEEIFRQDDYANYLYYVISGKVKCVKIDSYGKTIVNEIHGANSFIGYMTLLGDGEYHETAIAMEDSELAVIPKNDFVDLIRKNRDVSSKFIKMLAGNVRDRENRLLQMAYAPVRERVANALLMLKDKTQANEPQNEIRISRDDLASVVGTAKESLIRMLSEMKKDGLIESDGLAIKIVDAVGLKKISCD